MNDGKKPAYSAKQACEAFGIGIGRVLMYEPINTRRIRWVKVGARRPIPAPALTEFLAGAA